MKAVVFDRFGDPAEVLGTRDVPLPEPGPGQVRVRMRLAPINPSDLLVVRGQYGRLPPLPATPGFEGVGVIDAAGPGLLRVIRRLRPGKRVVVLNGKGGNWQEQVVVSARQAVPVGDDIPDEQAAAFFVNPATVVAMTHHVFTIPRNEWVLQTAAASTLGRMVLRLGKWAGFRTINVVRRSEQVEELLQAGGEAAICSTTESIPDRVREITAGAGVKFAFDAVGGTTGAAVVQSLAPGGRLLVYGTLSGEPILLDPRTLMVGHKCVEGFWLSEWVSRQRTLTMLGLFRFIHKLLRQGVLTSDVAGTHPLEDVQKAVRQAEAPGRHGKVLLRISS
jgi:NADPH:quinone reductase-like Zn-dependent oxidoreductase